MDGVIKKNKNYKVSLVKFKDSKKYQIHSMKNTRVYFNKITDVAYINNNKFIKNSSNQIREFKNSKYFINSVFRDGTPHFVRNIRGRVCSLLYSVSATENYWHWMFDVLPKLAIFDKSIDLKKIDYFLFPEISKKFQNESLNLLNIPNKKRLSAIKFNHISSDEVISCDHPYIKTNMIKDQRRFPKWIGRWFKKIITKNKIKRKAKQEKVFIDRGDSKNIKRSIVNEKELKNFLLKNSFKVVKLSKLSFREQISLFYNSKCIVGLHGAGFANIVFCRPKTKIIEIGTTKISNNIIYSLAKSNNLKYSCIFFKPVKKNIKNSKRHQDQHIIVKTEKIKKALIN